MNYFLDTEFNERPGSIDLISIAIVDENGRSLYFESKDYDESRCNDWVRENVLPRLRHRRPGPCQFSEEKVGTPWEPERLQTLEGYAHNHEIADAVRRFIGDDPAPVFWGYYADYDWVVFCWLFDSMTGLPKGWPMYCRDLQQECDLYGVAKPPSPEGEHDALADARWNRDLYLRVVLERAYGMFNGEEVS